MPSPKTMRPFVTLGELTVGSFRNGVDLDQSTRSFALGAVLRQVKVPTLNAPRPETNRRSPTGTGEATKCSSDFSVHRTFGLPGPALPSALPVRWVLPR